MSLSACGNMPGIDVVWYVPDICRMKLKDAAETPSYSFCLDPLIHKHCWLGASGELFFFFFLAFKQKIKLCFSDSHRGCFDWSCVFLSLSRLAMRVGTNPFTLTTAYLANQKPLQIATLDIFVAMNGVMESMWCGLQRSSWTISSSETKGLWSKLMATKTKQRSLFVSRRHCAHSGPHLSFSQLELLLTPL